MAKASVELNGLEPHSLGEQIASMYTEWNTGRQVWLNRVKEVIQYVYATSTRETTNSKNPWSHSTVIPKLTQIHDNLGANYSNALFGNRQFFTFDPAKRSDATAKKRAAIVNYLATKHDYSGFRAVMKKLLDDWVQTGNCFCRVEYVREVEKDSITGEDYVTYEGPKVFRISPYDIVFDPTVAEFKDSPKIIRELVTRGELFRRVEDSPEGQEYDADEIERLKKFYSVISGWKESDINKNIQMQMDGFASPSHYFRSGKVELLHFVGDIYDQATGTLHKSQVITVVDRRCVIRQGKMDDYQGFGRIYHAGWRKRTDNLWAQGPLDNLVGMQYLINHLENARADGFDQMLSPDRVHIGAVEVEKDGPVTNYFVDDAGGDVRNLAPDPTVLNADNQIALKEAQMEAYAGAPREAMGIRTPGEKTAFEVSSLQNAAGRLFQTKIEDFEQELVEPVLNGELEVAVRNLNTSDVAKVLDEDFGVEEFVTITRDDLVARGVLKARGASHYAKRAQLVQELQAFSNVLAGDPDLKVHFPAKPRARAWNEALGFEKLELYQPFGQIDEQVELAEHQQVAQEQVTQFTAAGVTDAEAQDRAAGAAGELAGLGI
ncbi:MAG: hypothetical protein RBS78_01010 [Coriobacteriia bacterium]|jgi:hypothetical protein|nr:hypothetical protein [Coriobacteriia bacterium]